MPPPDGPPDAAEIPALGRALLRAWNILLRTAQVHDRRNEALARPVAETLEILARLDAADPSWLLRARNDYLHLLDTRIRIDFEIFAGYRFLLDELGRRRIGALGLGAGLGREGLLDLVYLFVEAGRLPPEVDPYEHLAAAVGRAGLAQVRLEPADARRGLAAGSAQAPEQDARRRSLLTYAKAVFLTREVLDTAERRRLVNVRRVKKLVTTLVEIMDLDESVLLGLTSLKDYDEYTFQHSVNVCVLSLAVGRRMGLSRRQLGDLGLAAVFHDLGKVSLPERVVKKPGPLDPRDREVIERHPIEGVRRLAGIRGLSEVTNKLVVSVLRHHNNLDRSGYPPLRPGEEIPLFSRIIRIVDSYDAMTSARIYRRRHRPPVEAIEELWHLSGRYFEPAILKVFIAAVGIYPVGTVVQLSSGEIALVLRNQAEPEELLRPVVRTVASWDGREVPRRDIDLAREEGLEIAGYYDAGPTCGYALDLLL